MSTQEEDDELKSLSPESVLAAIDAVKGRSWDVNPFTVADELKVSRAAIYRHADVMKLIIAARGGSFGMDMQTSLDLTWQLRKLEQEYNDLKEKLASGEQNIFTSASLGDQLKQSVEQPIVSKFDHAEDAIFNLASNEPYSDDYSKLLADMSWKDVETIYYFKVASLKDYAANLFGKDHQSESGNGEEPSIIAAEPTVKSSGSGFDSHKHERLSSGSPFAQLKSSKTNISSAPEALSSQYSLSSEHKGDIGQKNVLAVGQESIIEQKMVEAESPAVIVEPSIEAVESPAVIVEPSIEAVESPAVIVGTNMDAVESQSKVESKIETPQVEKPPLKLNWYSQPTLDIIESQEEQLVSENPLQSVRLDYVRQSDSEWTPISMSDPSKLVSSAPERESDTGDLDPVILSELEVGQMGVEDSQQKDTRVSGDELRNLIQSHIKNAADQMSDTHSIGSGKEFEVWFNNPGKSKFVGSTKAQESSGGTEDNIDKSLSTDVPEQSTPPVFKPRIVPPEVRKSCLILGIRTDNIVYEAVQDAWKKAIAAPGVHPDQGGDTEMAVYLNTAKDVLMRWLDAQAPKLGKKFGPYRTERDAQPKKDKNKD